MNVNNTPVNQVKRKRSGLPLLILLVLILIAGGLFLSGRFGSLKESANSGNTSSVLGTQAAAVQSPVTNLGKDFAFTLTNGKDKVNIKFTLDTAQLENEIIVNGQKATAIPGRTFLIINTKITNSNPNSVQLNTRDFVRLENPGNSGEWLAPDIYNDPVEVQALSTKYSRLGFPVDSKYKDFNIQVGQIDGAKQMVEVHF